jgi:hypothetical protein
MEELLSLKYKEEIEALKELDNYEEEGDKRYLFHEDVQARLYWAFCRPSGSHPLELEDEDPIVAAMAFNHSRLRPLQRFRALNKKVVNEGSLRIKIKNRARMLFRDLVDQDLQELNEVLDLVPVYLPVAVDQLKNGQKWNAIGADEVEATKFLQRVVGDKEFLKALLAKLTIFEDFDGSELKEYLLHVRSKKELIAREILENIANRAKEWLEKSDLHVLQKKSIEKIFNELC